MKSLSLLVLSIFVLGNVKKSLGNQGKAERKKFGPKEVRGLIESQDKIKDKVREYIKLEEKRLQQMKELLEDPNEPTPEEGYANPLINYRIIKKFARSELFNKMHSSSADDEECFHIGRMAYGVQDYYHAALWMEETWNRMKGEKDLTGKDKIPVLDFWSFSLYQEGNVQRAWWLTKEILKLDPKNERVKENIPYYETEMKEKELKMPKSEDDLPPIRYISQEQKQKEKKKQKKDL